MELFISAARSSVVELPEFCSGLLGDFSGFGEVKVTQVGEWAQFMDICDIFMLQSCFRKSFMQHFEVERGCRDLIQDRSTL
jgi:hypothetical protein